MLLQDLLNDVLLTLLLRLLLLLLLLLLLILWLGWRWLLLLFNSGKCNQMSWGLLHRMQLDSWNCFNVYWWIRLRGGVGP